MKTLPDAIIAGMRGDSERVILVRIIPESGDTWGELLWATKDITITDWEGGGTSKSFAGGVLAEGKLGTIKQSVDIRQGGNVATVSGLTLTICNPEYNGENRFDQSFTDNLENRKVEIRMVFWAGSNPAWSDTLLLYKGVVEDVDYDYGIYKIKIRDAGFKRHKEIPDLILTKEDYPELPENNKDAVVPLMYGSLNLGNAYLHNLHRPPMLQIDRNKLKYIISANKTSSVLGEGPPIHVYLYYPEKNRYVRIFPVTGSFSYTEARPTTLEFPLKRIYRATVISQLEGQGSQTDPGSLNFSNAVDNSVGTYLTLSAGQKLYLRVPLPIGLMVSSILHPGNLELWVDFGAITEPSPGADCGYWKYYNSEYDAGVGGFSTGKAIKKTDQNLEKE